MAAPAFTKATTARPSQFEAIFHFQRKSHMKKFLNSFTRRKTWLALSLSALTLGALAQALPLAEGEVRRVDKAAGKISLKHGEIKNLDMPPMSMVFEVKDPALLNKVKAGDKVVFTAAQINGVYTVMSIDLPAAAQAR
jgi:Cu(I)/Ag(I) efflux system protein CusF